MQFIESEQIQKALDVKLLIQALEKAFAQGSVHVPMRHHHDYPNPPHKSDSTLLMMPAWQPGQTLGVKLVTVSPENAQYQLPAIQGVYLWFDARTGECRYILDAKSLTALRTAATSALASSFLSRDDSECLLMVGTGALAPELIRAHVRVRPIKHCIVWGRDPGKADSLIASMMEKQDPALSLLNYSRTTDLATAVSQADIISCATLASEPIIKGRWLKPGQHLDLVGAYRPHMREADDDCIRRSQIYVDHYAGATTETGDLAIPLQEKLITMEDIHADLFELCAGDKIVQRNTESITLFKSVGHALEDLVAANCVVETLAEAPRV